MNNPMALSGQEDHEKTLPISDDFGSRSPDNQKQNQTKIATSIVALVY